MSVKVIRLSKVARELNTGISQIVDLLASKSIYIDSSPNTKLDEETYNVIINEIQGGKSNSILDQYPVGNKVVGRIIKKIEPGTIFISTHYEITATISILDISWNLARAEMIYQSYQIGDHVTAIIIDSSEETKHIKLSLKEFSLRPSATKAWNTIKLGNILKGEIIENLPNTKIVKLENELLGIINKDYEYQGDEFQIIKKDNEKNIISLSNPTDFGVRRKESTEEKHSSPEIDVINEDLLSLESFKNSLYSNFAAEEEVGFIEHAFETVPELFSKQLVLSDSIILNFEFNSRSWDSFQSQIVPSLIDKIAEDKNDISEAIAQIEKQSFWINLSIKKYDQKDYFTIYNDSINFYGSIDELDSEACQFTVFKVSSDRKNNSAGMDQKYAAKNGSFLLNNGIIISPPGRSFSTGNYKNQHKTYEQLKIKTESFQRIEKLKVETGEIIKSEGEALKIFDKFLEYQEDYIKSNQPEAVKIDIKDLKRTHGSEYITWVLPSDVYDYLNNEEEYVFLDLREKIKSSKQHKEHEYKKIGTGKAFEKDGVWLLSVEDSLPLDEVKELFIQKKVSVTQFQLQREIIRDFFDKKLKLDHVENLLVRPDKIKAPLIPDVNFKNEFLQKTEKDYPDNNQVKAVKKAIGNQNVFLIQGPPGTGKTTVISEVVQQLVANKKKILVASQTHVAVDNVLEKLASNEELSLLRVGPIGKISENLKQYHTSEQIKLYKKDFLTFIDVQTEIIRQLIDKVESEEIKKYIRDSSTSYSKTLLEKLSGYNYRLFDLLKKDGEVIDAKSVFQVLQKWKTDIESGLQEIIAPILFGSVDVVFATCIGIKSHSEFKDSEFKFDTVIIDEAGKANLAESLVAISMAKNIILVGDQMQLPPFMDSNLIDPNIEGSFPNSKYGKNFSFKDIEHALKTSFFEFLVNRIEGGNFPKDNLEKLNYQHRMHPNIGMFVSKSFYNGEVNMGEKTHLNKIELPKPFDKEITFINTGSYTDPYESSDGYSATNRSEAETIVQNVLPLLLKEGVAVSQVAIIAPYKSQVALIQNEIESSGNHLMINISVSTLDSFQGMEFDVIIFSFTRSASPNQQNKRVGFLDDARRLNVAFSRAKKKLILVGNKSTLTRKSSHFDKFFDYTGLFTNLVDLSKTPEAGRYCEITDFKELKSSYERFKEKYPLNSVTSGIVKSIVNFGIFVTVDGFDGLAHKSNLSHRVIKNINDLFEVDQEIKVKVIGLDDKKQEVEFGIKQLNQISEQDFKKKYPISSRTEGYITRIANYGIFVNIEGHEGLVHKTNIPNKLRHQISKHFILDQKVMVEILDYKDDLSRISFGLNNAKEKKKISIQDLKKKYPINSLITCPVKNVVNFGVFIEIEEDVDGLVHTSQLDPNKRDNLKLNYPSGKEIEVLITDYDFAKKRIELSESLALLKLKK